MTSKQVAPLTGILFVVLVIAAVVVSGETPGTDDSRREIISFYLDNDSELVISSLLLALACVAFAFFLAAVRQALRAAAGDDGGLSTATLVGGVMLIVGASIFAGIGFTLGDAAEDLPPSAILALNALNSDLFFPLAVGTAVFSLSLGLAVLRHGGLPRPLGWLALVIGILGVTPVGFFAFLAMGILIIWASIVMTGQASQAPQAPQAPQA